MTYVINKYNGQILATVPDGTVNTTATSIKLPGRNYPSYGEPVVEDIVYMLENFAGAVAPTNPLLGQLWWDTTDTNNPVMKVYDGVTPWSRVGRIFYNGSAPAESVDGQLWYNTSKQQLFIQQNGIWKLVGPMAPADQSIDLNVPLPTYTTVDVTQVYDNANPANTHYLIRATINGEQVAVFSKDSFTPNPSMAGFASIRAGLTINSNYSGVNLVGKATSAGTADNALALNGIDSSKYMRIDQTNVPTSNNTYNLGSSSFVYANVYATTFHGTATAAQYADVAERYHADETINAGTVVCLGGEREITTCKQQGSEDVLGVISSQPAVMLNSHAGSDLTHPYVALVGRVPVKVMGPVCKGQRLMSSHIPGVAMAWQRECGVLAILGRSLQDKPSSSIELVEAVVGVH
jgi:Peptidase_G2, IMC autoproteolytic cleavage domain